MHIHKQHLFILIVGALLACGVFALNACTSAGRSPTPTPSTTPTETATPSPPVICGGEEGFCERLAKEAYTIVQGRVTSPLPEIQRVEPTATSDGYTYRVWEVDVEDYLKNPQPWETVRVRTYSRWITHCGVPEPPMKQPSLTEGEPVLLFLDKRHSPYEDRQEVLLENDEFTIAGPYIEHSALVFGKFSIAEGNARAWAFSPTMGGPWEPFADILAVVKAEVAGAAPTPTPMYQVSREEAIQKALALFAKPLPEETELENPRDPEARLMTLGSAEDLLYGERTHWDSDSAVWLVQVRGEASQAGIVPPESRMQFSYAMAIIDARGGTVIGGRAYRTAPVFGPVRPGTLSGEISGLEAVENVMLHLEQYLPETGTTTGTPLCTFGGPKGTWEAENIPLAPGWYAIVAEAEGYVSVAEKYRFQVPERGVFWRNSGLDFKMVRPEEVTARPTAMWVSRGMSGIIEGLPEGTKATVRIQLLPWRDRSRAREAVTPNGKIMKG